MTALSLRQRRQQRSTLTLRRTSITSLIFLCAMSVYFLFPVYWLVISSLKNSSSLFSSGGFAPAGPFSFFSNIGHVFSYGGGEFVYWIGSTLLYAVVGGGVATILSVMAGYGIAKYEFRGRGVIFGIIIGGVLVPVTALALPLYLLFHAVSLINTVWSVLLPSMVSPFGVYLSRIYASRGVPEEVIDAARIEGAGEFTIFRRVGLRLMAPALVTIFLFQFVSIWNNFFLPLIMLTNSHLFPLSLGLYNWSSRTQSPGAPPFLYSTLLTGALVSIVPLVIAFALLQRFWVSGLAIGAVEG